MDWSAAHREAMVAAFDAHEQLGLDTFGRVDVFDAMVGDGLRLVFRRLEGSAALYLPAGPGGPAGAIVNARSKLASASAGRCSSISATPRVAHTAGWRGSSCSARS